MDMGRADTEIISPDVEKIAKMIAGSDAEEVVRQLRLAHETHGEAFRTGRVHHPDVIEWINLSNSELDRFPGARWLVKKRTRDIPRVLSAPPLPLFFPRIMRCRILWMLLLACLDSCRWVSIQVEPDPENEFPFLPVAEFLDVESALALGQIRYAGLVNGRNSDPGLLGACIRLRGQIFYERRGYMRWLGRSRFDAIS